MADSPSTDRKSLRTRLVKGKPIFKRHLYISSALFLVVIGAIAFSLIELATRWASERVELEMEALRDDLKDRIEDRIRLLDLEVPGTGPADELRRRQLMESFLDELLARNDQVVYVFAQHPQGDLLWQRLQMGKELERSHFPDLILSSRSARGPRQEIASVSNPGERLVDWVEPLVSRGQLRLLIHFGFNNTLIASRVAEDQSRINRQILLASTVVLVLLLVALFYVRWLLKKAQWIEAEAHTADRLAVLGMLASGLAHEIRNPLSAINLNLQMIEEEVSQSQTHSNEMTQLLAGAKSEIRRLERLARNFLVYAKPMRLDRQVVSVPEVLDQVVQLVSKECERAGIELVRQDGAGMLEVRGDRDLLKQAVMNLLVNAREAVLARSDGPRRISMGARRESDRLVVWVRDSGTGIPEAEAGRLFDLFYSSKRGGTGLGLPIAQRIVEAHGGRLEWKNGDRGGAEFSMLLDL